MTENISSNKTIAKNTLFLYVRMLLLMFIGLYTSRVYLEALGAIDIGVYQIVGGLVSTFTFLNASLSGATSRFLTYELGKGNTERLKDTFATSLNIHIVLAIVIFLLSETIGLWFLENYLNIPNSRMYAARVVYQLSIFSCCFGITQIPYSASIISHEKMNVYAYISICEVILKLISCFLLFIIPFDRLIVYAIFIFVSTILIQIIYRLYCIKHFDECHFKFHYEKNIVKPMLNFSFWDLFGNFGVMMRGQGINIVLNIFCGPVINAACGFSSTVQGAVRGFVDNFMTAIRPSVVKSYSSNDFEQMQMYMINASKYAFSLMLLLSIPLIFESKFVIDLWLKTPPDYTYQFCVISLCINLVRTLFSPLMFGIHATGKIRNMSVANGAILIIIVPISYFLLKLGATPIVPFIVDFFLMFVLAFSCAFFLKQNMPQFNITRYLKKATLPSVILASICLPIIFVLKINCGGSDFIRFIVICVASTFMVAILAYWIVFDKYTRHKVNCKIVEKIHLFV